MFRRRLRERLGKEDRQSASLTYSGVSEVKEDGDREWEKVKVEEKEVMQDLEDDEFEDEEPRDKPKTELVQSPDWKSGEKDVFEEQLELLNEQLMAALTENQELKVELESSKHGSKSHQKELEKLKKENRTLQTQLERLQRNNRASRQSSSASFSSDYGSCGGQSLSVSSTGDGFESVTVTGRPRSTSFSTPSPSPSARRGICASIKDRVISLYSLTTHSLASSLPLVLDFLSDFTEETESAEDEHQDELKVNILRDNLCRLGSAISPGREFLQQSLDILQWKNTALSLVVFLTYMYCVWSGWILQLLLLLCITRLSINHFYATGLAEQFGFKITKRRDLGENDDYASLGFGDKYQLMKQVGQYVQNRAGQAADHLEKGLNLILWCRPEATYVVYKKLWMGFVVTLFMPNSYTITLIGLGLGIKFFIIDIIYRKYPKFKAKYNSFAKLWNSLPTNAQLLQMQATREDEMTARRAAHMVASSMPENDAISNISLNNLTDSDLSYCDRFQVGPDELPLENWKTGRRCTLLDKKHPLTGSKSGRLYLSQNIICFERSTQLSEKSDRFSILLKDIASINKAKPFAVMPGSGMSIEIHLKSSRKPLLFGAILHRDQAFREVCHQGMVLGLPWGSDPDAIGLEPTSSSTELHPPSAASSAPDLMHLFNASP